MAGQPGHPPKYKTPEDLEAVIEGYFDKCHAESRVPTIAGLAYSLGFVDRRSIYDQEARSDGFSHVIKKARLLIEAGVEAMALKEGKAGQIFWLKNHAGYKDQTEVKNEISGGLKITANINLV